MFLATTAIPEFWDKEQELLFLGTWCLRFSRRSEWEGLKYSVLQSPWNDRERFYRAATYVEECADRLLQPLADHLNAVHGVTHSLRYWRILVGPWLFHFLGALYDRVVCLDEALRAFPNLDTRLLAPECFTTPSDTFELVTSICSDVYNLQLYSQILTAQGYSFPTQLVPQPAAGSARRVSLRAINRHGMARSLVKAGSNAMARAAAVLRHGSFAALCDVRVNIQDLWLMALKSRLRVLPFYPRSDLRGGIPSVRMSSERTALSSLPARDTFEHVAIRLLPQNFPTLLLEGYGVAREVALRWAPRRVGVIGSAMGWYFTEPLKFFAAERSERNARLVSIQHGGGYGVIRHSACELHEKRVSDVFMTWGWARDAADSVCQDLPDPRLSKLAGGGSRTDRARLDTVLMVATGHPRYLFRFHTGPVGSQFAEYFAWQVRFLGGLPSGLRRAIRYRAFPADYGQDVQQRLAEQMTDLAWDPGGHIYERLAASRVVVIDQLGTTVLEAFVANVPTLLFWDPERWEVRSKAKPLFDQLRRVGILWDSPEGATQALIQIYDDPEAWWRSEPVQAARSAFTSRHALTDSEWKSAWLRTLTRELGRASTHT